MQEAARYPKRRLNSLKYVLALRILSSAGRTQKNASGFQWPGRHILCHLFFAVLARYHRWRHATRGRHAWPLPTWPGNGQLPSSVAHTVYCADQRLLSLVTQKN